MYLSDRDLQLALDARQLIFIDNDPPEMDTTGIDLHLDKIEEAKIWDVAKYEGQQREGGNPDYLGVGRFEHRVFSGKFATPVRPKKQSPDRCTAWRDGDRVRPKKQSPDRCTAWRDGDRVILPPGGFVLWQTREVVGTPEVDPRLICFVDGKSSRARAGLLVHMTAPTIHAGWWGNVTLEIANLGPFTLSLEEGDPIAQIVVAVLASPPKQRKKAKGVAVGQAHVTGSKRRK